MAAHPTDRSHVERVLEYERLGRELELLEVRIETQQLQQAVLEAAYRMGQGETMLASLVYVDLVGKTEDEAEELVLAALQESEQTQSAWPYL